MIKTLKSVKRPSEKSHIQSVYQVKFKSQTAHELQKSVADLHLQSKVEHKKHKGKGSAHFRKQCDPSSEYGVRIPPVFSIV